MDSKNQWWSLVILFMRPRSFYVNIGERLSPLDVKTPFPPTPNTSVVPRVPQCLHCANSFLSMPLITANSHPARVVSSPGCVYVCESVSMCVQISRATHTSPVSMCRSRLRPCIIGNNGRWPRRFHCRRHCRLTPTRCRRLHHRSTAVYSVCTCVWCVRVWLISGSARSASTHHIIIVTVITNVRGLVVAHCCPPAHTLHTERSHTRDAHTQVTHRDIDMHSHTYTSYSRQGTHTHKTQTHRDKHYTHYWSSHCRLSHHRRCHFLQPRGSYIVEQAQLSTRTSSSTPRLSFFFTSKPASCSRAI